MINLSAIREATSAEMPVIDLSRFDEERSMTGISADVASRMAERSIMGSLRVGVTRRELKFVADMLDCSAGFVKPGSFNVRMHVRSVQSVCGTEPPRRP